MNELRPVMDFITANENAEARRIAAMVTQRFRIPIEGDEILSEVVIRILAAPDRLPMAENPAAYFTRACQNVCRDLLRRRVPGVTDGWDQLDEQHPDTPVDDRTSDEAEARHRSDHFRSVVEHRATELVTTAGVLAWFVLASDPHIDVADVPRPKRGVEADRQLEWPALWFATRDEGLFSPRTAAARRRQRLLNQIYGERTIVTDHVRSLDG